jgi:oxygen-dependent protoporphyrinogen oxidase
MAAASAALASAAPRVALAGAAVNGVGIPACIGSGRAAARHVLAAIG